MHITFRQLQIFAEVARQGSSQRAAAVLHITPPAVSMQIKELEAQVGLPLFDREGRQLTLSTAGEYFLVHARRMLAALKDAEGFMASFRHLDRGQLTIGMVSTAKYFVPQLLARFHEEHPGIDVRLREALNREQLVTMMKDGEVDLSVMGRPPREIATRAEPFAAHPLVFVCPANHPMINFGHMPLEALAPYSFIVRERGSGTRTAMDAFCAEHHFEPNISMEVASNETIKQSVIAGLGLSLLSLHTIGLELRSHLLHVLDVEDTPVMRSWFVVRMQSRQLSPAAEAFRYFIIERGEAYLLEHDALLLEPQSRPPTPQ
jgi:LysR family transcriptional regulator, low CO2-responsive transcriptional regulator